MNKMKPARNREDLPPPVEKPKPESEMTLAEQLAA